MSCLVRCVGVAFMLLASSPLAHGADDCAQASDTEGGSNLWVTNFMARCRLNENQKRSAFFRNPPSSGNQTRPVPPSAAR